MLRGRIEYLIKAENRESLLKAQELLFRTEELLAELLIIPISQKAADEFERTCGSKLRGGASINAFLARDKERDIKHFKQIPGVRVVNWVD